MSKNMTWFRASKDLQTIDSETLRGLAVNIPPLLNDATLLLVRKASEPIVQYIFGDAENIRRAGELSGFKVTELEDEEEPEIPERAEKMAHALIPWRARLNGTKSMEKLRTDIHQVRRGIETILPDDSYLSVTFRERGFFENRRIRSWIADEGNTVEDTSDLVKSGSLLARVTVGSTERKISKDVVENAARGLFPDMSDMSSHASHPRLGLPVFAALLLVASVLGALQVSWIPVWLPLPVLAVAVYGAWRWWSRAHWDDIYQVPRHDWRWSARKRLADKSDQETRLGLKDKSKVVRAYPTQRTTMIVEPLGMVSLFMPVGTAQAVSQSSHPVPEVLSSSGIYLGRDESDRPAYIPLDQLYGGIGGFGEPGSGKSALSHGIMQWAEIHRQDTDSAIWGEDSRIISFDMKDDEGVETMRRFEKANGLQGKTTSTQAIYLADPNSVSLDLLGLNSGKSARETAVTIARSMQYSFDDGDIKGNSLEVLARALTIGVACERYIIATTNPETGKRSMELSRMAGGRQIIDRIHQLEQSFPGAADAQRCKSVIGWALMAVGAADGQSGAARALGQVCGAMAAETDETDWKDAKSAAEALYGRPKKGTSSGTTITDRDFLANVNSSMNKLTALAANEHVFTSRRGRVSWEWILANPGNYHIVAASHNGKKLAEGMDKILGAWMLYSLWNTITDKCQGRQRQGKHTMLVCDELSLLSTADAKIPSGVREQGRSLGVIPVFFTQYASLLPDILLTSVKGYATFVSFSIPDPAMAEIVAGRMGKSAGWTDEGISNLPRWWAAIRTRTSEQLQPAFTIKVHDFDHDFSEQHRH